MALANDIGAPVTVPNAQVQAVKNNAAAAQASLADGKGFEKIVNTIGDGITKFQISLEDIFEGKPGKPTPSGSRHNNPLDYGLIPLVRDISSIDLCNIFTHLINKAPKFKPFVPKEASSKSGSKDKPDIANTSAPPKPLFINQLEFVQQQAYEVQLLIDNFYSSYGNINNIQSRLALTGLIQRIGDILSLAGETNSALQTALSNAQLNKTFPQLSVFSNFFNNANGFFSRFTDLRSVPQKDIQKIISYVDKIRSICVAIQGLDSLAAIVQLGDTFLNGQISQDIAKLNKLVKPERLIPTLKSIQQTCVNIQNICKVIIGYIGFGQTLIRILTSIVDFFNKFKSLILLILPIPNIFTSVGVTNTLSDVTQDKVTKGINNFISRLNQINQVLYIMIGLVDYILIKIDEIIGYIQIMIINLESCKNADPSVTQDLKKAIKDLENSRTILSDFKKNYEKNKNAKNTTYGDKVNQYKIDVLTEQLTDPAIQLKRRYGVALDKYGAVVVESTPTFASDTSIIVGEVKLLLVSKGLVNTGMSQLSSYDINTINESLNFLDDPNISFDMENFNLDITNTGSMDDPNNENEDTPGLNLNAFINKLPGGKKLRKRMRAMMLKTLQDSSKSMNKGNVPNSISASVSSAQNNLKKQDQIQELNEQRTKIVSQIDTAKRSGAKGNNLVEQLTKKLNDIDQQLKKLQK